MPPPRHERRSLDPSAESRSPFQRDRDRILYSGALRRLVGVTQVIGPSDGEVFHNRLTHTLKVAQVARRFAERFTSNPAGRKIARQWGGINPDVVEAAALAHDLGHPPFGHIAETELANLVRPLAGADAFEGNAQSFRIITRLAVRRPNSTLGLDLTRATLNATLKYPWLPTEGQKKYGAFREDSEAFNFARASQPGNTLPCPESQIMDWADDITYSVHDTEDFYRAGLVPLHLLAQGNAERVRFLDRAIKRREKKPFRLHNEIVDRSYLENVLFKFCDKIPIREAYSGTRSQRGRLAQFISDMVSRLDKATSFIPPTDSTSSCIHVPDELLLQVALLKELIGVYVIDNPALAAHEFGQRQVIRTLFTFFYEAAMAGDWKMFPPQFRDEAEEVLLKLGEITPPRCARLVADTISAMTDQQAVRMHQRLTGQSFGPPLDPIVT